MNGSRAVTIFEKQELHARNLHRGKYDFPVLVKSFHPLGKYVIEKPDGDPTINFADPEAVKSLNRALLRHFYNIDPWDIPEGYLCPPIPGRADYVHYLADLISDFAPGKHTDSTVRILDTGVGANCIYPLIGHRSYNWNFVGSETDQGAIKSARNIIEANSLSHAINIRRQGSPRQIFKDVIHHGEYFDATMCNPPFHASPAEAFAATSRKWKNLGQKVDRSRLNFGGKNAELWCLGGEAEFLKTMIRESVDFQRSVGWFTCLVSKKESLTACNKELTRMNVRAQKTIPMSQGQKTSRMLAWTFH